MKNIFFGIVFVLAMICLVSAIIKTQNATNYHNACVLSDPLVPVEYKSFYIALFNAGPQYYVTYKGHTRWNNETCTEQKCVGVKEYNIAKAIIGETE